MTRFIRYEESRPAALRAMLAETPTAYLPIGPLRWEGEAVPLGQAGIRARRFCEEVAAGAGGVVFPPIYWRGFGTGGLPFTFEFDPEPMGHVVEEGLRELAGWGFEKIVVCDGGGASLLGEMLAETCDRVMDREEAARAVELTRVPSVPGEPSDDELGEERRGRPETSIRFEESGPEQVAALIERSPVAYVPLGALEWHGEHGPLGLDGIKAHHICERAAQRTGGVVFPTIFWGAFDTMPFPFTFHFERAHLKSVLHPLLTQLSVWGFQVIVLLTGHYPPTHIRLM